MLDAEIHLPAFGLGEAPVALALGAEHLQPAAAHDEIAGAGFRGERVVLGDAVLDQLRVHARHLRVARRARVAPVAPQERRERRQRRRMVVRVDGAVQPVAQERAEIVREAVRKDALALDQAGVAEGSFLGGAAPVDERHGAAALLQVQGDADADDARAENGDVVACH